MNTELLIAARKFVGQTLDWDVFVWSESKLQNNLPRVVAAIAILEMFPEASYQLRLMEELRHDINFNIAEWHYDPCNGADKWEESPQPFWSPDENQWMI